MKVQCVSVIKKKGFRKIPLKYGKSKLVKVDELVLVVILGDIEVHISIDEQFRKRFQKPGTKYAAITIDRLMKIADSMPEKIEVGSTKGTMSQLLIPNGEIMAWFVRINN